MFQRTKIKLFLILIISVFITNFDTGFTATADAGILDNIRKNREERRSKRNSLPSSPPGIEHEIIVNGKKREFVVYGSHTAKQNPAVIIAYHGGEGNGKKMADLSQLHTKSAGYLTVYPTSINAWNDGRTETHSQTDDIAFTDAMINFIEKNYSADRNRIFATGVSNGGMMTHRLACERTRSIRAFATVVANFPAAYIHKCSPQKDIPIIMFNGTSDTLMHWGGGEIPSIPLLGLGEGGKVTSTPETYNFYIKHNACDRSYTKNTLPDKDTKDGARVTKWVWDSCRNQSSVTLYKIDGGAHGWPGSDKYRRGKNPGQDIDASTEIIKFFRAHGL